MRRDESAKGNFYGSGGRSLAVSPADKRAVHAREQKMDRLIHDTGYEDVKDSLAPANTGVD